MNMNVGRPDGQPLESDQRLMVAEPNRRLPLTLRVISFAPLAAFTGAIFYAIANSSWTLLIVLSIVVALVAGLVAFGNSVLDDMFLP